MAERPDHHGVDVDAARPADRPDDGLGELGIGQVAERTGLSVHAFRFYEREGILANPVERGPGGRRLYREDDVERLTVCIVLRASGRPIPAIRRYTELVRQGVGNEKERLAVMRRHQDQVNAQIARLTECLDLINYKVGVYEDILADQCLTEGDIAESTAS